MITGSYLSRIEDDTDNFGSPKTVSDNLSRALMDARNAKKITQKQLAADISVHVSLIQNYENGSAIPDPGILNKLDRALGIHLPRTKKKWLNPSLINALMRHFFILHYIFKHIYITKKGNIFYLNK